MTFSGEVPIIGRPHANRVHERIAGDDMGRGDARTRKGKIFKGSYGKTRPHKAKKSAGGNQPANKAPARRGS
jgi:30S ribosomal protein S31